MQFLSLKFKKKKKNGSPALTNQDKEDDPNDPDYHNIETKITQKVFEICEKRLEQFKSPQGKSLPCAERVSTYNGFFMEMGNINQGRNIKCDNVLILLTGYLHCTYRFYLLVLEIMER